MPTAREHSQLSYGLRNVGFTPDSEVSSEVKSVRQTTQVEIMTS
jgi:hypothetical protein